ncbi:peptidylprolyl isomerase [Halosquirtibacter xylanolyticus]|uniref:peptidylprolyl isomerase n=1 Tax=Halosquirtibacter xylanolyticus TaxID=3374599 RepID=UPI003749D4A8|nr:peptidylprolyl isomerase [Prolixibacteraceae bacterium]
MNKHIFTILLTALSVLFFSCGGDKQTSSNSQATKEVKKKIIKADLSMLYSASVDVTTYDNQRKLEKRFGFMIAPNLLVCPYKIFSRANNAKVRLWGTKRDIIVDKFIAVDRIHDLIILQVDSICSKPFILRRKEPTKRMITKIIKKRTGKLFRYSKGKYFKCDTVSGSPYYRISNLIPKYQQGVPVIDSKGQVIGMGVQFNIDFEKSFYAIPSYVILSLLKSAHEPKSISSLRDTSTKEQKRNAKIKSITIVTTVGNIKMKLFNNMPQYRDNFVKLINEGFYNDLLFHRVIESFVIQSGAADTRDAGKDDIVGWKGPGYTLPAFINPKYFHQRGMIGSPRLPNDVNTDKRSDGGQFYIVQGRRYNNKELDDIEKENHYKFTNNQRKVYSTRGGAPTLDGEYTIFGEIISGMDVVDKIAKVEVTNNWRPLEDIRIKKIIINY